VSRCNGEQRSAPIASIVHTGRPSVRNAVAPTVQPASVSVTRSTWPGTQTAHAIRSQASTEMKTVVTLVVHEGGGIFLTMRRQGGKFDGAERTTPLTLQESQPLLRRLIEIMESHG
jgi:hypothetical protein